MGVLGFRADPERRSPPSPLPPVPLLSVLGHSGDNLPSVISAPRSAASPPRFSPLPSCHDLQLGSSHLGFLPLRGGHAPLPPGQREPSSCTQGLTPSVPGTHPLQSCCWSLSSNLHPLFVFCLSSSFPFFPRRKELTLGFWSFTEAARSGRLLPLGGVRGAREDAMGSLHRAPAST